MVKKIKFIIILLLLCLIPKNVNALSCSSQEKARLKKIMSNINISYDYTMIQDNAMFSIKFNNLNPELYFKDQFGNVYYDNNLYNDELVLYNYADGKSYTFSFYGTNSCTDEKIGNLYVTTPSYNPYYKLSVCDNAKEFELCQKWVSHSLSRSEFIEKVNKYKIDNNIIDDSKINKKISVIDFIMNFIRMYGLYIVIAVSVIIIIIKIIRYKKDTFGF